MTMVEKNSLDRRVEQMKAKIEDLTAGLERTRQLKMTALEKLRRLSDRVMELEGRERTIAHQVRDVEEGLWAERRMADLAGEGRRPAEISRALFGERGYRVTADAVRKRLERF